jgi:drug/metabolite transporter (DMT)-like permease
LSPSRKGALFGLGAVAIWGGYLALARLGVSTGLTAADFSLLRYGVAGLVLLPWVLRHAPATLGGIGWGRAVILSLLAGPPFILFGVGGYAFAPLAHGAVFQPATVVIVTTVLAALVLKDRPTRERLAGIAVMIAGLALIAGPSILSGSALTPVGDAMFAAAGALWAGFTILARRWGLKALPATAAVATVSMLAVVPWHLATQDLSRIAALAPAALLTQVLVQGVLSGIVAVVFFTRAAELLGPAPAAIFPALVPAAAILLGIPVTGEWPTAWQTAGLVVVSLGLLVTIGAWRRFVRA